jgi:spore germination protein YaaH
LAPAGRKGIISAPKASNKPTYVTSRILPAKEDKAMRRLVTFCTVLAQIATLTVTVEAAGSAEAHPHTAPAAQVVHAAAAKTSREIFGYAMSGSLGDPNWGYTSWNWSLLTTVAYFAIHIADDGSFVSDSDLTTWNSDLVTGMLSTAHASGAKVLMTIDLQDFAPGNPHMCAALANRTTTVAQTVAAVRARGADGVSVDFEGLNGTCPNGQTSRSMMVDFTGQLRAALGTGSYLSVSTYASSASDALGFFDIAGMSPYVDSFFVMAYDLEYANYRRSPIYCYTFCLGPTAPLSGYYYNDTSTASEYVSVVPASQVILGVPYYGRKACVGSAAFNPYPAGPVSVDTYLDLAAEITDPSVRPGSYVSRVDSYDPTGQEQWNTWYNTSLGCERELYIDSAASLGAKYDLINRYGLRGAGIWALNYGGGAPELWSALRTHFAACTGATAAPSLASPQAVGAQVQIPAAATGCASPLYQYWILPPGGSWSMAQAYSPSTTFNWTTSGLAPGSYRVSVWARDVNSQNAYDAFSAFQYSLTPACSTASASTVPSQATNAGNNVTITVVASACPNPTYEFWVLPPGGIWTLARPYASGNAFTFATAGRPAGAYRFSVWARDAGSPNAYDAFSAFQYTLNSTCSSTAASTVPSQATIPGNNVTITAAASGCGSPLYEFWVLPPGGTWTLAQGYSTSASLKWSSAGKASGSYRFSVWARDASSAASYDSFSAFVYTLLPACSSVGVSTLPSTAAGVGNNVTVTASVSGCSSPLYEFWLQSPGGTWTMVQGYAASPIFKWVTAGKAKGTYRFSVWARDASSPGYSGSPPYTYDAFNAFAYSLV